MQKYKLTLAYDGTHYGGWQIQPNAVSIQSLVEKALSTALRTPASATASGRTDAGVHARGQVAHFTAGPDIDLFRLQGSLNGLLPPDIRVLKLEAAPSDFHARYSAVSKEYHYHLHLEPMLDPFKRLYAYHIFSPLDLDLMKSAAQQFMGTHDFTSFANEASEGSAAKDPVRTLMRLDVCPEPGGIRLEFEGDGFLYKMVRNITGALLDAGRGKLDASGIAALLKAQDRRLAPAGAPPHGLFLMRVDYNSKLSGMAGIEGK